MLDGTSNWFLLFYGRFLFGFLWEIETSLMFVILMIFFLNFIEERGRTETVVDRLVAPFQHRRRREIRRRRTGDADVAAVAGGARLLRLWPRHLVVHLLVSLDFLFCFFLFFLFSLFFFGEFLLRVQKNGADPKSSPMEMISL